MPSPTFTPASWNTDVAILGPNTRQARIETKWKNYLGPDGTWKEIDCNFKKTAAGWEVTDAPFIFRAPATAQGEAYFESNVRYDIFEQTEISDAPFWMKISASSAAAVPGEIFDMNGNGRSDSIIYRNAFPAWNADLIYYVEHGRAPRLRKLVRFNSAPGGASPAIRIPFSISFSDPSVEIGYEDGAAIPLAKQLKIDLLQSQVGKEANKKQATKLQNRLERLVSTSKKKGWNKLTKLTTQVGISHRKKNAIGERGIGFKDFHVWDSTPVTTKTPRKKQCIDVEYTKTVNGFTLTKIIPTSFFNSAVFPVFTDLTGTFYPDANAETTSVDGQTTAVTVNISWSSARDAAGTAVNDLGTTVQVGPTSSGAANSWYAIDRGITLFDTSSLSGALISAAVYSLYGTSSYNGLSSNMSICVAKPTTTSNTALTASDHNIGGWTLTDLATRITQASWNAAGYNDFTLNADGRAAISKGGITKLGVMSNHDFDNSSPTYGTPGEADWLNFASADAADTTTDPKLYVTYTSFSDVVINDFAAAPVSGTPTSIALSWTDVSGEDSYSIERSPNGTDSWTEILTPAAGSSSATDTTASADTTYYYKIRAVSGTTWTAYATANAQSGPATPTGAAAVGVDGTTIVRITWTDVATSETAYSVERSDNGTTGWAEIGTTAASATSYDDDLGAASTTKYYRVRAKRSAVGSAYTGVLTGETAPAGPLTAAAVAVTGTYHITVTWSDEAADESGYSIERSTTGSSGWAEVGTAAANAETFTDTTITTGDTLRYYRVRALRSSDGADSAYSNTASATTAPQAPSSVAVAVVDTLAAVTWADNSTTNTGYKLEKQYESEAFAVASSPTANATSYADPTPLIVGHSYTYRLSAYRSTDTVYSPAVTPSAVPVPPEEPSALAAACTVSATAASKILLTWSVNSVAETGFLVERSLTGVGDWSTVTTTAAGVDTYLDTSLAKDTTYYYRVSAVGTAANSAPCTVASAITTLAAAASLLLAFRKKTNRFPLM